jgi:hypothetical protein
MCSFFCLILLLSLNKIAEHYSSTQQSEWSKSRSRIRERTISLRFLGIILRVLDLGFPYTMFTLQTRLKPLLLKEENSSDFCPTYVQ